MLNRVTLTGRLTRDPELRYTNSGTAVARFNLAVDRQYKNQQTGEREADFINVTIWRKGAENFCNFTHKGSLVGIDGRLTTSSYQKDGQTIYQTFVTAENFVLLEPRSSRQSNGNNGQEQSFADFNKEYEPHGNGFQGNASFNGGGYSGNANGFNGNNGGGYNTPSNNPNATFGNNNNGADTPIDTDSLPFNNGQATNTEPDTTQPSITEASNGESEDEAVNNVPF